MSTTPKTPGQMVEYIAQVKREQEAEWRRLYEADERLQALALWTVPDLVEAIAHGRVHIAPGHDPALTAPTTAREALDLAWSLAHVVREGQTIPKGAKYLERYVSGVREYVAHHDVNVLPAWVEKIRTLDPLPDPEPDWLDAPAVKARVKGYPVLFTLVPVDGPRHHRWHSPVKGEGETFDWQDLTDVTPLYPKGQDA